MKALLLCLLLAAGQVLAQSKPVRIIVPFPPGGTADALSRLAAERMAPLLGQQIMVENRAGAGGNLGAEQVSRAEPDGSVLLASPPHLLTVNPLLYKLNFDPAKFVPVGIIATYPNVLVASTRVPAATLDELITLARASPGKLTIASQGNGTISHLSAELLKKLAGIDLVHVPYRGTAPALGDLLGGQVDVMFDNLNSQINHIKEGRLRALGVTSATRSPYLPDVPTVGATVPGYEANAFFGVSAPRNIPADVLAKLNGEINAGLRDPAIKKRLEDFGAEPSPMSPDAFTKFVSGEVEKWGKVLKAGGIKAE